MLTPIILSASRATDIPAFHARRFIDSLRRGYVVWRNPFNGKSMNVSFERCKVVVFWTKNPRPMMPLLRELDDRGIHYYFQFTLNDYEREGFEPDVPPLSERVETFRDLASRIGKERVIWRFDPLIVTPQLSPHELLTRIWNIGNAIRGCTEKLVFSFIDVRAYRKVQSNMVKETSIFSPETVENAEPTNAQMCEISEGLSKIRDRWRSEGWDIALATCAEVIDLEHYGIEHNRCIDGELMKRIFADDRELVYYLNYGKLPESGLLFDAPAQTPLAPERMKDRGQRNACGCMKSKDIGAYNTCSHFCVYCYANTSREAVRKMSLVISSTT